MNDGTLFYWFMWMGWVFITFLMPRSGKRNGLGITFLLGIMLSGYSISFSIGSVNMAFLFFLCIGFFYVVQHSIQLLYYLSACFIVATSYVAIELFALYDPVKFIIEKKYLFIVVLVVILMLLSKRKNDLFFVPLIGLFIGDALYQILIYRLNGYLEIGSMYVLDLLVSSSMILLFMVVLVDMFKKIRRLTFKKVNSAKQI
ncbi:hypothetical protein KUV80_03400 [Fictibacillus nanhaiensis]|uniref:YphA family membrane protein n=1 Tax=Fictibacillus nanhaiensis TaxID=742169 RepID=UPI001C9558E0|nr:hypothetical protein [Fictibacillus nanhaiensis]MBY6035678.1 hypothetical protein [Fictibacillus nanhaiensis]